MRNILSVGLPVFNEENFLEETLVSILNQSFSEFELIISDNNSSDSTQKIVEKFSKKDSRIKFLKNKTNIGMINNFNLVVKESKGKYFMWAGAHDIFEPDCFKTLIEEIEKNDFQVSLVFSDVGHIDGEGKVLLKHKSIGFDTVKSNYFVKNFTLPFRIKNSGDMVYGIFQRNYLLKTKLLSQMLWPDVLLIYEVSSLGKVKKINSPLRWRRYPGEYNYGRTVHVYNSWEEKYTVTTKRQRKAIKEKESWDLYLPTLVMTFRIVFRLGIFRVKDNPILLFWSFYFALIYLWKHKVALFIDFKIFFKYLFSKKKR